MMYTLALLSLALGEVGGPAAFKGDYYGKKRIVVYDVKIHMDELSPPVPGYFSLKVTGAPSGDVNCPKEAYEVDGDKVLMPNYGKAGNCATEQFKAAKLKFEGATWDEKAKTITVKSKWHFFGVDIVCHKQSGSLFEAPADASTDCAQRKQLTANLKKLTALLDEAQTDLKSIENDPVIGAYATKLLAKVTEAANMIDADGPKLEAMTCANCNAAWKVFDTISAKLKAVFDDKPGKIKTFMDALLDKIGAIYKEQCSTAPTDGADGPLERMLLAAN